MQECCSDGSIAAIGGCPWVATCNGEVYNPSTQECCGSVIVPTGQCCSGLPYDPSTQECCSDGRIVSTGQCDPPPLCNNEPFDPVTQECCGSTIVPLGSCCNGVQYDPTTEQCCGGSIVYPGRCCNGAVYDPSTQECCGDGTIASTGQCGWQSCNGAPYDPATQMCCGEAIYESWLQCCNGQPYDSGVSGCCNGLVYDLTTQECCSDGVIAPLGQCGWLDCSGTAYNPSTHGCCAGQVYNLMTEECCGVTVVNMGNCCNGTPMDPLLQGCCDNNQTYDLTTEECCGGVVVSSGHCCSGQYMDPAMQGCCNGQVYTFGSQDCCSDGRVVTTGQCDWLTCDGTPYDSATHGCCNGHIWETATEVCCEDGSVALMGQCPPPPSLCNGQPYDTTTQGCCNNEIYYLSSYCCMNDTLVSLTSTGSCPSACGEGYYDPATQGCCAGQAYELASQICCGSTVVTTGYCCNGAPFDPGTQECCSDGSLAPTGQCDWPICGSQRLDPSSGLACCNGATYNLATQLCCNGTDIVDIGQCNPSLCNGVQFGTGYECCNGEIVPLGNCCGNQIYTPSTHGCGGGHVIYELATQEYNPNTDGAVPIGQGSWPACNGTPYDSMINECCVDGSIAAIGQCPQPPLLCGSTPYDSSIQGCCNGQTYTLSSEDCCSDGRIVPTGQCDWLECNGAYYYSATHECCSDGTIALIGQCNTTAECNGATYNSNTHECCNGMVVALAGRCCTDVNGNWGVIQDPDAEECCGIGGQGVIVPKGTCAWSECGIAFINPRTTGCCQGDPYSLATHQCCATPYVHVIPIGEVCMAECGTSLYNPNTAQCCYDQIISLSEICYPECSPGVTYNPETQDCCYGVVVLKDQCPVLDVSITGACGEPCVTGVGTPVDFTASASHALGTVSYSWYFSDAADVSGTEGSGPITAKFKDSVAGGQTSVTVTAVDRITNGSGSYERTASTNIIVNVAMITFVHANADGTAGGAMNYIPIWTPNDGVDKGPPILDSPASVFQMTPNGATMSVTLLGTGYSLTRDPMDTLLYTDASSGLTVRLNQEPLNDVNVAEYLEATVSLPSAGIANSLYGCDETAANSSVFAYYPPGLIMTAGPLDESQPDTITLNAYQTSAASFAVTETGANTLVFTNSTVTASLLSNPSATSPLVVKLTAAGFGLSDTVVQLVPYGGSVYRNFAPPIPTSVPPASVPADAAFHVEVRAPYLGDVANQPFAITILTEDGETQIAQVNLTSVGEGVWRSENSVVLCSGDVTQMTSSDQGNYQAALCPPNVMLGNRYADNLPAPQVTASTQLPNGKLTSSTNVLGGAVAIEYLKVGGNPRTDRDYGKPWSQVYPNAFNVITNQLVNLGFQTYADRNARYSGVADYIANNEIWYSLAHGHDEPGYFVGIEIADWNITKYGIETKFQELKRTKPFRLALVNSCLSAQTSKDSYAVALASSTLIPEVEPFVKAFVGDPNNNGAYRGAYIGWGWAWYGNGMEYAIAWFLNYCVGPKVKVGTAFETFALLQVQQYPELGLMKLFGNPDVVVDLRTSGYVPY